MFVVCMASWAPWTSTLSLVPRLGNELCSSLSYLCMDWVGDPRGSQETDFLPEAIWCICCWNFICSQSFSARIHAIPPSKVGGHAGLWMIQKHCWQGCQEHIRTPSREQGTVIFANHPEWCCPKGTSRVCGRIPASLLLPGKYFGKWLRDCLPASWN